MLNGSDLDRARSALQFIPADLPRDQWLKAGMSFHAAGGGFDDFDQWSAQAESYNAQDCRATWRSFKSGKGIGAGTLFAIAREYGHGESMKPQPSPKPIARPIEAPTKPRPGMSAAEVWERCEPATHGHPYIVKKRATGVPLDRLRVLPAGDGLTSKGERMAGALVVPVMQPDGALSSLQLIAPPDVAERLKAKGETDKPNLSGHTLGNGRFIVGELVPGGVAYICEGIGTAWACWQASYATPNAAAVVCFGSGRVRAVAAELRQRDATARLVLVPDVGKESDAQKIALEVGALVATMPAGEQNNFDANDLAQRDGGDVLAYHMQAHGLDFIDAAKALDAWVDDGKPYRTQRPKPLPASQAIQVLGFESLLTYIAAGNIAHGVPLSDTDRARLLVASQRIQTITGAFA